SAPSPPSPPSPPSAGASPSAGAEASVVVASSSATAPDSPSRSRRNSAVGSMGSGVEFIRYLAQHRGDLLAVRAARVAAATQVAADAVEQLHEVFDDDRHVVGGLAGALGE